MKSEKPIIRFTDILTDSYEFDTFQRQQMFDDSYTLVFFKRVQPVPTRDAPIPTEFSHLAPGQARAAAA